MYRGRSKPFSVHHSAVGRGDSKANSVIDFSVDVLHKFLDFTAQIPLTLNSVLKSYQAESAAHK